MSTSGLSSQQPVAVGLSVGFLLAPITFAISNLMDRFSTPEDGANIGAGIVALLSVTIFVCAVLALVVVLLLQKVTRNQSLLVVVVAAASFVLMALMWNAA